MAFLMFGNAMIMTAVLEFSFSEFYSEYVWFMQIVLYVLNVCLDLAFTNFVHEVQVVIPLNVIQAIIGTMSTLAAKDLLNFLLAFFVSLALQVLDRAYVSANQDYCLENATETIKRMKKSLNWLLSGARAGGKYDADNLLPVLDVQLSSDEEALEDKTKRAEGKGKKKAGL